MIRQLKEMIAAHQTMHAYWYAQADQVRRWLEAHPGNAAGEYDLRVYQRRAEYSYQMIVWYRGF